MVDEEVSFLDPGSLVARSLKAGVGKLFHGIFLAAGETYRTDTLLFAELQSPDNVFRLTARGESHDQVFSRGQGFHLSGEKIFIAKVIGNRGQHRDVVRERERWQALAGFGKFADIFAGHMHGIGSTAAIAEKNQFAAGFQTGDYLAGNRLDLRIKTF